MKIKPTPRNLKEVFEWLDSIGLSVYGLNMDVETGQGYFGQMDYTAEEAAMLAWHVRHDTIKEPEYE